MDDPAHQEKLDAAIGAAEAAGVVLRRMFRSNLRVSIKGPVNFVTEADIEAERVVLDMLQEAFPGHGFLSEERGREGGESPYLWIIDPLDGTTNYAHGYPGFCISIALEHAGDLAVGVIHDPVARETFWATRGGGAFLNGEAIQVSSRDRLDECLLATGFSYDRDAMRRNLDHFGRFMHKAAGVRRDGSAARDLSYLACGRFDGVWEVLLNPWDLAAGFLIIAEAGGRITDFRGRPCTIRDHEIILSNGRIHEAMMRILQPAGL
ncbi:MAG: inositol monophosphatase [Vicinamibacteria bacterium]|nr:inositol monophosphatase [Vicinamibacteria bacterium]